MLDRTERPKTEDEREKRILTPEEQSALLGAIECGHQLLFRFAMETGARLGEVLGITWRDIDLEAQTVSFTYQLDKKTRQRVPLKTARSRRCIEITPGLVSELRKHKLAAPADRSTPHDLVFLSRAGTPHNHRNIEGRVLGRAITRAGLEAVERDGRVVLPKPTFHDLRHTHASALIAQGFDVEQVSSRLGHSSVAVTQTIYVHSGTRRAAVRRSGRSWQQFMRRLTRLRLRTNACRMLARSLMTALSRRPR
jgi:integrase